MLQLLRVIGLGPLLDVVLTFDPEGETTLGGGSECGKSTAIDAICFALWECDRTGRPLDVRQIQDGQARAEIELQNAKGATLARTITTGRSLTRRLIGADGSVATFASADAMAAKLGPIGAHADIGRILVAPMQWVPLLQAELGRPFRDLVSRVLPAGDLRATVAAMMVESGHALHPGDNLDTRSALAQQTAANSHRDVVRGRLQAAEQRAQALAGQVPAPPAAEVLAAAEATLQLQGEWEALDRRRQAVGADITRHEAALAAHSRAIEAHDAAMAARENWRARFAALGPRPVVDAMAKRAHEETLLRATREELAAQRALQAAEAAVADAERELATTTTRLAKLRESGDACPTCRRPGWAEAAATRSRMEGELQERQAVRLAAIAAIAPASQASTFATAALAQVRESGRVFEAPGLAVASWDAQQRALGPEPQVPLPPVAPSAPASAQLTEPARPRPDGEIYRAAMATRDEARTAGALAARHATEKAAADTAVTDTRAALQAAEAECKRVVILVDATRRAPTEIARQQAAALGDMGCVSLRFPPKENKQTPEVEVLVDGRPWHLASEGKQVYADALLRCALRRAAAATLHPALAKLPIFIDRVRSWSRGWDGIEGPVVYLVTDPAVEQGEELVDVPLWSSAEGAADGAA